MVDLLSFSFGSFLSFFFLSLIITFLTMVDLLTFSFSSFYFFLSFFKQRKKKYWLLTHFILLLLLLLCSDSRNDVPPVPQRNVSIAAERGAVRPSTLTHFNHFISLLYAQAHWALQKMCVGKIFGESKSVICSWTHQM